MKLLIAIVAFAFMLISGCTQVEHITSVDEIKQTLVKHFGPPNEIDTLKDHAGIGVELISYRYGKKHDSITFDKANDILSKALRSEIAYTKELNGSITSKMVLLKEGAKSDYVSVFKNDKDELVIGVAYHTEP